MSLIGAVLVVALVTGSPAIAGAAGPAGPSGGPPVAAAPRAPAVLPSAGCGTSTVAPGQETLDFVSGGVDRTWIRHVPPVHDGATPVPLVMALHGFAEGVAHPAMTEYGPKADEEGFAVAFPQALGDPVAWNPLKGSPDSVFFEELLDHIEASMCIDTNRVYVSGFSLGAVFTSRVACDFADRIAAVAPVAGVSAPADCTPARPVPVLSIHGTDDALVPYTTAPPGIASWAARNGCAGEPAEELVAQDDVGGTYRIVHPCPVGAEVELHRVEGGGHAWPGSAFSAQIPAITGHTTFAFHASDLIWDFFEAHVLRPDIVAYTAKYPEEWRDRFANLVAGLGLDSAADVVELGTAGFRRMAEAGQAVVGPQQPAEGPVWVTVTYPVGDAASIEAAAAAWGATGEELHHAGGRVVSELIRAALRGETVGAEAVAR